jgi:hypothetical protein
MNSVNSILCASLLCALVLCKTAFAADEAIVRLVQPQTTAVMAGERLSFTVELLVQGQFSGPTYFALPNIDGAIIMQVSERPILGTQQISDETYVSARHNFAVYAQRAGRLHVPSIIARFGAKKSFDQPTNEHRLQTEPFNIKVTAPPGAVAGEVVVSTSELTATETWSPKPVNAKVGDAFIRTITVHVHDAPAMLLPPPNFGNPQGFAVYPESQQIQDHAERGEFIGERIDTVTYVSTQAGSFEIPELTLRWWDSSNGQWQTEKFPAHLLSVADNPALATQSVSISRFIKPVTELKSWIGWFILMVTLVVALRFAGQPVKRNWQAWRTRYVTSEVAQWKRLRNACDRGEAAKAYGELGRWLAHFNMATPQLTTTINEGVSDSLRATYIKLQQRLAGIDAQWDAQIFIGELTNLRRTLRVSVNSQAASALPPLNPPRAMAMRER